jgi:hypothetical protein
MLKLKLKLLILATAMRRMKGLKIKGFIRTFADSAESQLVYSFVEIVSWIRRRNLINAKKKLCLIPVQNDSSKGKSKLKLMTSASKLFMNFQKSENLSNGIYNTNKNDKNKWRQI